VLPYLLSKRDTLAGKVDIPGLISCVLGRPGRPSASRRLNRQKVTYCCMRFSNLTGCLVRKHYSRKAGSIRS